jgi:hypothetical protein
MVREFTSSRRPLTSGSHGGSVARLGDLYWGSFGGVGGEEVDAAEGTPVQIT